MDNNFMDEEDSEEIFDDSDVIELDEAEYMFGEVYNNMSSEDSNPALDPNANPEQGDEASAADDSFALPPEQAKLLADFSLDESLKQLNSRAGTGDVLTYLYKQWQVYVPVCFNAQDNPRRNIIDKKSDKVLIKPLEAYLCNEFDTESFLSNLTKLDDPPQLCGKVFKNGEPSYFCRYEN
jgi:hypothetical protein